VKYLKKYNSFFEDGTAAVSASSTAGMGAVSSAQPGAIAGTTGTEGSGDLGFTFKKEKRKKGNPSQVADMRDLAPAKGVTKVKESVISQIESRDPNRNSEVYKTINDCLVELFDEEFTLSTCQYHLRKHDYDINDDEVSTFNMEELEIKLSKRITKLWTGNIGVKTTFDENGIVTYDVETLRPVARLHDDEQSLLEKIDDACHSLINQLDYESGILWTSWKVSGSAMPYDKDREINVEARIILSNVIK
jgi:hypothetical protein